MRNVKRMVAAGTMMAAVVFGTTLANAGIIIAKEEPKRDTCRDSGGIGLDGIIIAGIIIAKTGIIIAKSDDRRMTCGGIIIASK